jgi:phage gp29-like protein
LPVAPPRQHHRDLPIVNTGVFDEVSSVRAALADLERGYFTAPAQLAEAMLQDDRIEGILQTRVDALFGLPLEFEPRGDGRKSKAVADELRECWDEIFPQEELKQLLRWGLLLRYAPAELVWSVDGARWMPRIKVWNPRHSYWRWDTRTYQMITQDGTVDVAQGSPEWAVYTPSGYQRGWVNGLIRPLGRLFLMRQVTYRDWLRWSEVHGLPIRKGVVPASSETKVKEQFIDDLLGIGQEATIQVERDDNGNGFDVELVEAASQSWEGFRQLIAAVEENAAILVLGQNLTTSVKGGSFAAANVHDRIRMDRVEADARSVKQVVSWVVGLWAQFNFGDATLAPDVTWSTKAPEDRKSTAETLNTAGDALAKWRAAGVNVDRVAYAKRFGLPLDESEPLREPEPPPQPAAQEPKKDPEKNKGEAEEEDETNDA